MQNLSPEDIAILRSLTPSEKLHAAAELYWGARKLKLAGFRALYPGKSEEELQEEVRKSFLYARD